MLKFTHIKIESKAFPLDENFSANCDEAGRQGLMAEQGRELHAALKDLLLITEVACDSDMIDDAILRAKKALLACEVR
jgi:hypothetical protein